MKSLLNSASHSVAYASTTLYLTMLSTQQAFAAFGGSSVSIEGAASGNVRDVVTSILDWVLSFLMLIAVIFVVIGGFRILTAGGNEENVTKGRKTIIYAIIGILVIFFANVIIGFFTTELSAVTP